MNTINQANKPGVTVMSGREFKAFYSDELVWGKDGYWEDGAIVVGNRQVDDPDTVNDDDIVEVHDGCLQDHAEGVPEDMQLAIAQWRSQQVADDMLVTVPKDKIEAFKAMANEMGVQVHHFGVNAC